jgi:hypothetical protein
MSPTVSYSHVREELALLRSLGRLRRLASLKMFAVRSLKQKVPPIVMPVIAPSDEHPVSVRRHRSAPRPLIRNPARGVDRDGDYRLALGE